MHKFTGKERDGETGNDNFGARYFGSGMGRFLSPDPSGISLANLSDPQQLNLYSYVRNNPLSLTDPTGLDACSSQPFNNQGTEVNNDDCNSSTSQMGAPDPGPNLCTGNGCVTAGGVDIFDAISGRPGTFMTTDMYGNLHWGFSSDMWIASTALQEKLNWAQDIIHANNASGLSDAMMVCTAYKESGFNPGAVNPSGGGFGAIGLFQVRQVSLNDFNQSFHPSPAYTKTDLFDPVLNTYIGTGEVDRHISFNGGNATAGLDSFGTGPGYSAGISNCAASLASQGTSALSLVNQ